MSAYSTPYLPAAVSAREAARRRTVLVGIAALILLGISPVFGHHIARGADTLFQGRDHVGELCLVALHVLLAPVHGLFHILLAAGLIYAVVDRARVWWRTRRVLAGLGAAPPRNGDAFWRAAHRAGLTPGLVRVVDDLPNPAFTVGWLAPKVFVARALARRLSGGQLAALLAHEGAHVARRDPLRLSVLRFFACTLFWLPALRRLADDVADEAEIQADDRAAGDEPLVLASAIVAVARLAQLPDRLAGAVGFTRHDLLERRVRRLAGENAPVGTHVTRRSIVFAAAVLLLVWVSGTMMAHPMAAASVRPGTMPMTPASCTRHPGPPILHVFCPGITVHGSHYHCPHAAV